MSPSVELVGSREEENKMAKKVMRLVDSSTGMKECKVCGAVHIASIKPMSGGCFYRGSWQCQYGCKMPERTADKTVQAPEADGDAP
jgi:hypothetical protein